MTQREHDEIVAKVQEIFAHDMWVSDKSDLREFIEWLFENFEIKSKPDRKPDES